VIAEPDTNGAAINKNRPKLGNALLRHEVVGDDVVGDDLRVA
jgi:hypothetical protein